MSLFVFSTLTMSQTFGLREKVQGGEQLPVVEED